MNVFVYQFISKFLLSPMLVTFLVAAAKCLSKATTERKVWFWLPVKVNSITAGMVWQQERGATDHIGLK